MSFKVSKENLSNHKKRNYREQKLAVLLNIFLTMPNVLLKIWNVRRWKDLCVVSNGIKFLFVGVFRSERLKTNPINYHVQGYVNWGTHQPVIGALVFCQRVSPVGWLFVYLILRYLILSTAVFLDTLFNFSRRKLNYVHKNRATVF